ncbi:hypothetical protein B7Z17_03910, partial [Candidatus Saccharibacteria bacterium 32-49-10]
MISFLLAVLFLGMLIAPAVVVPAPATYTYQSLTLYASAIVGYMGLSVLLWSLLLGIRSIAGFLPKKLTSAYNFHSLLGKYGTLLIFLHPILVMMSYQKDLGFIFIPQTGDSFARAVFFGQIAFYICLIIWVTSALLREKISWRPWKYIHFLGYLALPFAVLHVPDTGSSYTANIVVRSYFFLIYMGLALVIILRIRSALHLNKQRYTVIGNVEVAPRVHMMTLEPHDFAFRIRPERGQYIYLKAGVISEDHPFSVLTYDDKTGILSVAYKTYGRYTRALTKKATGDSLYVTGAFGDFTADIATSSQQPSIYIAGGIGITPFAERLLYENDQREQWLFYANRDAASAAFETNFATRLRERYVPLYDQPGDKRAQFIAALTQ